MRAERYGENSSTGEKLKVVAIGASEQTRRIKEAVARRAYEIFQSRGSSRSNELEDWRQAEAELMRPRCSGQMSIDGTVWVGLDGTIFKDGTVEIWIAPRKMTICGTPRMSNMNAYGKDTGACCRVGMIFHALDLAVEIDPSCVTAKFRGPSLQILLRKAQTKQAKPQEEAKAAAA
jgi:Protein of unknown function (DUF2934)